MPASRSRPKRAAALSLSLVALLAGCGGSDTDTTASASASASASDDGPSGAPPSGGLGGGQECTATNDTPSAPAASAAPSADTTSTRTDAAAKAQAFLATLSDEQKDAVQYDFTELDTKRCSWSNFPDGLFDGRLGVKLGDLSDEQKAAAYAAVESVMSPEGFTQVRNQILGDDKLAEEGGPGNMGEDYYHLVFFGTPAADQPWTLQFGGHHLAVHVSSGPGVLSVSPHFSGSQPISFESEGETIRPMGQETDDMFGLFTALDETQTTAATLSGTYDDIVMGPGVDADYPAQEGLVYTELNATQQGLVRDLIAGWVSDHAPALAQPLLDLYSSQLDQTTIAFSGETDPDTAPAYFRIDGPRVWIEWISTDAAGFHYHTVYRDKAVDYGTGLGS